MRLQRKAKVVRFRRYNIIQNEVNFYREQLMLYLPWTEEYTDSDNINFKCIYESNVNLIMQNRSNFESIDQSSIVQAMNVLEDIDTDELNFDGIATEETLHNEGITVQENTEYTVDDPGDQVCNVDPTTNTASGGLFNVPSRMSEEEYFDLCRRLNLIQRRIYSTLPQDQQTTSHVHVHWKRSWCG